MSLEEAARRVGRHKSYFYVIRKQNTGLWDYLKTLDDDMEKAYLKYRDEQTQLRSDIETIYYELLDTRQLLAFSKWITYHLDWYNHPRSFYMSFENSIFISAHNLMRFKVFSAYKQAIKLYPQFKEETCESQDIKRK